MTTTYGIYAPALYGRRCDSDTDAARAACLGRSLLRWTVYSRSAHGCVYAVMCVSRHWTRRAAIQSAARLTAEAERDEAREAYQRLAEAAQTVAETLDGVRKVSMVDIPDDDIIRTVGRVRAAVGRLRAALGSTADTADSEGDQP